MHTQGLNTERQDRSRREEWYSGVLSSSSVIGCRCGWTGLTAREFRGRIRACRWRRTCRSSGRARTETPCLVLADHQRKPKVCSEMRGIRSGIIKREAGKLCRVNDSGTLLLHV
eukprot:3077163-Rhodomonas_salina.4